MSKRWLIWQTMFLGISLTACAVHTPPAAPMPPATPYTAQTTYDKLVRNYPFIRIASAEPVAAVRKVANLTYVQYGARALQLDLYLPASAAAPVPIVVLVHGGGWRSGDRAEFVPLALRLAERGFAAATVSYRLSDEAKYPAAIDDVDAAVRWVRAHGAGHGIDPRRIALAGGSAGGQIASLVGVARGGVQAVVNIDGLSDFTSPAARQHEDDPVKKPSAAGHWFGGSYAQKSALWREASPTFYVGPATPPILFIGSAQARFAVGREEMVAKMTAAGVPSRVLLLPDTPHSFWLFDPWLAPTVEAMSDFLTTHLSSDKAKQ